MKPLPVASLSLLSVGFALSVPSGRADEPANPPAPAATPASPPTSPADGAQPTPPPGPRHQRMRGGYVLAELTEKLGLSADQQKTIGAIIKNNQGQIRELRGDDSLSREDRRAKIREIATSTHDQIRAALSPDQQKLFDAMPAGGARPRNPDNN